MEEVREIAAAYFLGGPESVRIAADNFFTAMDDDGDGYISRVEFLSFMQQMMGASKLSSMAVFWQLNSMAEDKLNLMDIMVLYYVIKSDRPFCDGNQCGGGLICGAYFACTHCLYTSNCCFLCPGCFRDNAHSHGKKNPGEKHLFLDNFTLLHQLREHSAALPRPPAPNNHHLVWRPPAPNNHHLTSTVNIVEYDGEEIEGSSSVSEQAAASSLEIVPVNKEKRSKWKEAFKAFDAVAVYAFMATQTCLMM